MAEIARSRDYWDLRFLAPSCCYHALCRISTARPVKQLSAPAIPEENPLPMISQLADQLWICVERDVLDVLSSQNVRNCLSYSTKLADNDMS